MAEESLERELQCAICTDILYQPLTLLDCLHTFCGSCLKEWFTWQATSASRNRRTTNPYTCPSCREVVKATKVDWRANALLDGFLKANPDRAKDEKDKEEIRKLYKPGDDVLKPIQHGADDEDGADERVLHEVRELSMRDVDPNTARRRAERGDRSGRRQEEVRAQHRESPEELRRRQEPSRSAAQRAQLTESSLRQHDAGEAQIEHQPSLRSLLSADGDATNLQTEILVSIYAEGALDGIDLDNLTTEQEEELTDRIAEAYRRRQQRRDRSENRERSHGGSRSPQATSTSVETRTRQRSPPNNAASQEQSRSRPPILRPHLFERNLQEPPRNDRRSASSTSQRSNRSDIRSDAANAAARSATDLSQQPSTEDAQRERRRGASSSGRSATDPDHNNLREQGQRVRAISNQSRVESGTGRPPSSHSQTFQTNSAPRQTELNSDFPGSAGSRQPADAHHAVRPAVSTAAFAPEPVSNSTTPTDVPSIKCNRCERPNIQYDLHYNCPVCLDGHFNICLQCYRNEQGCNYWFGFGYRAYDRWYRNAPAEGWPNGNERPHVLSPRRYIRPNQPESSARRPTSPLQEGAFCESCFAFADDCYWYCDICLEGAWGFCDTCVHRGRHCTHPLLLIAHISKLRQPHYDPTKVSFTEPPHLRPGSYVTLPPTTDCDVCHRPIPPNSTRFHCYRCNEGDYDMCNECYRSLVVQGKINQGNGPEGWRRCLQGHRMAIVGYQDRPEGGHLRRTVSEPIGGWDFKEDEASRSGRIPATGLPPPGGVGMRCLAIYNYFPGEEVTDELAVPRNAEIREVKNQNGDWYLGVYAGKVNLFPSNHVRIL